MMKKQNSILSGVDNTDYIYFNKSDLGENNLFVFTFNFPNAVTIDGFSLATYNYEHPWSSWSLKAIDTSNENKITDIINGSYLNTEGNWLGIKGNLNEDGVFPAINHSGENRGKFYYDGSHGDVNDSDVIHIPESRRVKSNTYHLYIYLNDSNPSLYVYYVRFRGSMSIPSPTHNFLIGDNTENY